MFVSQYIVLHTDIATCIVISFELKRLFMLILFSTSTTTRLPNQPYGALDSREVDSLKQTWQLSSQVPMVTGLEGSPCSTMSKPGDAQASIRSLFFLSSDSNISCTPTGVLVGGLLWVTGVTVYLCSPSLMQWPYICRQTWPSSLAFIIRICCSMFKDCPSWPLGWVTSGYEYERTEHQSSSL